MYVGLSGGISRAGERVVDVEDEEEKESRPTCKAEVGKKKTPHSATVDGRQICTTLE